MSESTGNRLPSDRTVVAAYSYAYAILGAPDLALQATHAALGRPRSPESPVHWVELFDATRRAALSLRRSAQHNRADRADPIIGSIVGRFADASQTGDAVPVDASALAAAFASLPQPDQETLAAALVGGRFSGDGFSGDGSLSPQDGSPREHEELARVIAALRASLTEQTLPADEDIPGDYDAR